MIRPFHTLPDIMELGLLVARIQNESGADRVIEEEVMDLFFKRSPTSGGWIKPIDGDRVGYRGLLSSIDDIVLTMHEFLPESSWSLQAPSEQPATALIRYGAAFKARSALTPQRALLTAFLCLADQVQREAA